MRIPLPKAAGLPHRQDCRAAILLEVILALVLFVTAAAVIIGGLNVSINAVDRLRLNTHAADLALSVASELQLGIRSPEFTGPEPFDIPFDEWSWELQVTPLETPWAKPAACRWSKSPCATATRNWSIG